MVVAVVVAKDEAVVLTLEFSTERTVGTGVKTGVGTSRVVQSTAEVVGKLDPVL